MVVLYILTFWIGAIIHRVIRADHGKLFIYIHPWGPGTYMFLKGEGKEIPDAIADLKKKIGAKVFRGV